MMNYKKLLTIITGLLVVVLVTSGIVIGIHRLDNRIYTASINVMAVPGVAKITINGKHGSDGINKVRPGTYTVTVSYAGFSTISKQAIVTKGKAASVGIILQSTSTSTANWLQTHQADALAAEAIGGQAYNTETAQETRNQPLINQLPYIGPGFEYRVDYGTTTAQPNNPTIYIETNTTQGRQDALSWIQTKGANPSKMTIQYIDESAGP